jgi:hypothetical protein
VISACNIEEVTATNTIISAANLGLSSIQNIHQMPKISKKVHHSSEVIQK